MACVCVRDEPVASFWQAGIITVVGVRYERLTPALITSCTFSAAADIDAIAPAAASWAPPVAERSTLASGGMPPSLAASVAYSDFVEMMTAHAAAADDMAL